MKHSIWSAVASISLVSWLTLAPAQAAPPTEVRVQFNQGGKAVDSKDLVIQEQVMPDGSRAVTLSPTQSSGGKSMIEVTPRRQTLILDLDLGANWITSNSVRVPNPGGSTFELAPREAAPAFRAYLTWMISRNHSVRLLFAPLERNAEFVSPTALAFNGLSFMAGQPIDAIYKFNSYRLSYIYQFDPIGNLVFRVGFTANIRDAKIQLSQNGASTATTDIGFVPLLHLGARYTFLDRWFVDAELEGLAVPGAPGRAFDGALSVGYRFNDHVAAALGYRFIEGGADVAQVYNFAFIQTVFARLTLSL